MIEAGLAGILVVLVVSDPGQNRLWAAAMVIGLLGLGAVGLWMAVGGGQVTV